MLVECHAGQAWISLHKSLGYPPPPPQYVCQPSQHQSHRRASPSRLRRRAKRAQAFAAASAATETAEATVETSPGEDVIKVAEVVAPQPSHGPQDEVQPLQKRQADQACQVLPPHAEQAEQAKSAFHCYQVNQAQHEADAAVQAAVELDGVADAAELAAVVLDREELVRRGGDVKNFVRAVSYERVVQVPGVR